MGRKIIIQTWFKIEAIRHCNYFMTYTVARNYGKLISRLGGGNFFYNVMWIFENGTGYLCYPRENFDQGVKYIFNKTINHPEWVQSVNKKIAITADKYFKYAKKLENKNFSKFSDKSLVKTFQDLINIQDDSHTCGQITTWLVDADYNFFTNYLSELLIKKLGQNNKKSDFAKTFSLLTTPEKASFVETEALESLKVARLINKNQKAKKIFLENSPSEIAEKLNSLGEKLRRKIKFHHKKYLWLHYTYEGPVLELEYFIQTWSGLIKQGNLKTLIAQAKNASRFVKISRAEIIRDLGLNKKEKQLFDIAKDIVWLKGYRKDCMYYGTYVLDKIAKEIGRRLNLSLKQMRFFCDREIGPALLQKKFSADDADKGVVKIIK